MMKVADESEGIGSNSHLVLIWQLSLIGCFRRFQLPDNLSGLIQFLSCIPRYNFVPLYRPLQIGIVFESSPNCRIRNLLVGRVDERLQSQDRIIPKARDQLRQFLLVGSKQPRPECKLPAE